jgi:thioesterase domain-containing protein
MSEALGRELPPLSLFEFPTVEKLARAIVSSEAGAGVAARRRGSSPLVRVQPSGSRQPFFFLHAEYGGDGFYCLNLARHLGPDQPFFGLSPLGRDDGRLPHDIETMAAIYLAAVRSEQPHGPYSLGGFCSCAAVAWEMARQLVAAGEEVSLVALIEPPVVEVGTAARVVHGAADVLWRLGVKAEVRVDFILRAMHLVRSGSWRPRRETVAVDRRSAIADVYRRAVEAYRPGRFDGPVLCLASNDTSRFAIDAWRRVSSALTARRIPGDHESCILTHSRSLAAELAAHLPRPREVRLPAA